MERWLCILHFIILSFVMEKYASIIYQAAVTGHVTKIILGAANASILRPSSPSCHPNMYKLLLLPFWFLQAPSTANMVLTESSSCLLRYTSWSHAFVKSGKLDLRTVFVHFHSDVPKLIWYVLYCIALFCTVQCNTVMYFFLMLKIFFEAISHSLGFGTHVKVNRV